MITDANGNVALKYYQTIPHVVAISDQTSYAFAVRANICLAWVRPDHVEKMLNKTKVCCGGNRKKVYFLANENDVRRWTNGGGR